MPRYTVNHAYRAFSDGKHYGPFEAGTVVELVEADAEWVNRDSPGALTKVDAKPAKAEEPERQAPAAPNRQHKGGRNRAGG